MPETASSLGTTWRPGSSGQNSSSNLFTSGENQLKQVDLKVPPIFERVIKQLIGTDHRGGEVGSVHFPQRPVVLFLPQFSAASVRPGGSKHRHGHAPPPHLDLSGADPRRPGESVRHT